MDDLLNLQLLILQKIQTISETNKKLKALADSLREKNGLKPIEKQNEKEINI